MTVTKVTYLLFPILITSVFDSTDSADSINLCESTEDDYENYTESKTDICGCEQRHSCVRKCCRSGFHHYHDERPHHGFSVSICIKKNSTNFTIPIYDGFKEVYREDKFMVGMLDCRNHYYQYFKLDNADPRQKVYIQKNGSLYYHFYNKMYSNDRYCVDEQDGMTAYLCFSSKKQKPPTPTINARRIIHTSAKLFPLPFLLITFIVYALLPESSLHGRALMCHVISLIFGNSCLAVVNYYMLHNDITCQAIGYTIIFFMLASFFWMNVMCIDIWLAFNGLRDYVQLKSKLFLLCCFYAWGIPCVLILTIFLVNTFGDKNSIMYPAVGSKYCFVNGNLPIFLYYFGPILIVVIVNTVLFILTVINIHKVEKETSMLQHSDSKRHMSSKDDRKKFSLYWKLLFAMGINPVINIHVIQALSWSAGWKLKDNETKYIYYLKDVAHNLYGIFIFITYVCRKKTWRDLEKRYFTLFRRPTPASFIRPTALSVSIAEEVNSNFSGDIKGSKEEIYNMNNV